MSKKVPEAKEIFDTAEAFALASKLMSIEMINRESTGNYSLSYHGIAAIVANHAFAIEMYFKCISLIENGNFRWGHGLLDQYDYLRQSTKDTIKIYFDDIVLNNQTINKWKQEGRKIPDMDILAVLKQANLAFEEYRYMPDGNHQTYLASDIAKALRKYILEIKTDWINS